MKTFYRNSIFNNIVETWDVIRVKRHDLLSWTIAEKLLKREIGEKGEPGIDANRRLTGRGRSGSL